MLKAHRRVDEALVGGVLAGLALHLKVNRSALRVLFFLAFVLLNFLPALGPSAALAPVLIYVLLWLSMPASRQELTPEQQEQKARKIKTFYNYTMLGVVVNLLPMLVLGLFAREQLFMLLMTVHTVFLLLPATAFIVAGIIKAE